MNKSALAKNARYFIFRCRYSNTW